MKERSITSEKLATQLVRLAKRSSRTTSFPEGWRPGLGRLSRSERAKALPALHAKMELHLLNHAAFTRFCNRSGTASAFAFARLRRKWAVSSDRRVRPLPPDSHPPLLAPIPSTASWAPCHKVNPSAITSILRPSRPLKAPTSRSRTKAFGVTLAPASRHTWAAAHSRGNPAFPKPQPRSTLLDDGQTGRVGGHIGMCERTRARASGGVCSAGRGKVGPQFWSSCWWASHPMLFFHELPVKALGGFLLPTHLGFVGLWIFCKNDLLAVREFCPTGWLKSSISQRLGTPPDGLKATIKTFHKPRNCGVSHCWVSLAHHFQAICPTGPMGSLSDPGGAGEP